jgi:hypothetical protein
MGKPDLSDYKEVSERIADFRNAHPDGSLQSEVIPSPVDGFVVVKGYAYRSPDDPRPGTGLAWEPVPGKTTFTKDSELQNAETSAWGRAIIAVGASDASKVASANEVRNRREAKEPTSDELAARGTNKLKAEALDLMGDPDEAKAIYAQALATVDLKPDDIVPLGVQERVRAALQEMAP